MDNWSGETCSEFDPCDPSPCENDGVCMTFDSVFECYCVNGYHGKTCDIDACQPSPCGDGECLTTVEGSASKIRINRLLSDSNIVAN